MRILYTNDNINVSFNHNGITKETIFGLDDNNNIIQNITFQTNIEILDIDKFKDIIVSSNQIIVENGYLFYSYPYEISFCHYLCETVPKLYNYLNNYKDYKLLIPENKYNNLCKNILNQNE